MAIPKKETLHDRATRAYVALQRRIKTHGNALDKLALEVICDAMLEIKAKQQKPKAKLTDPNYYLTAKKRKLTGDRLKAFERFWKAFAFPKGKAAAADSWYDIPQMTDSILAHIIHGAKITANARKKLRDGQTPQYAQGWLTQRRWEDYPNSPDAPSKSNKSIPDAPQGWRKHALGAYQQYGYSSWEVYWQNYNAEAKQIIELTK
jgi:hypothetical protein